MKNIMFRRMEEGDLPYVFNSALQTIRQCPSLKNVSNQTFYSLHHDIIENLIKSSGAVSIVACDKKDTWFILGYCIIGKDNSTGEQIPIVHYAHVRGTHRKNGIFNEMLKRLGIKSDDQVIFYGFDTKDANRMVEKRFKNAVHRYDITRDIAFGR